MKISDILYQCHYDIILVTNEKDFIREFKKLVPKNQIPEFLPNGASAYTHLVTNGKMTAIVSIRKNKDKDNLYYLEHEAVHIFQAEMNYIGETKPGEEFEAYAKVNIHRNLMDGYNKLRF